MNYTIDINLQMPAYLQLYNQIKADIVKGIYPYGSKVPSKRTMAVETGISTITVEHAYALLCEEGYIESRERSGFFVVFRLVDGFASTPQKPVPPKILPHSHHANLEFPFSILTLQSSEHSSLHLKRAYKSLKKISPSSTFIHNFIA